MARLLLLIAAPSHLIFLAALRLIKGNFEFTFLFVLCYLSAALIQILILLIVCNYIVHLMWRRKIDPDSASPPFLAAFADLLGAMFLFASFSLLYYFNDPNAIYTMV
jgi:solute carrier family 41